MNKYYHGTTEENLRALLLKKEEPISCWYCSNRDNQFYFYDLQKMQDSENADEATCISRAFEQAQFQAAFRGVSQKMYVLEMEIDEELIEDDFSCENMSDVASCINSEDFNPLLHIKKVYICDFNHWYSPLVLASIWENEHFNAKNVDKFLKILVNTVRESQDFSYVDDILYFDYTEWNLDLMLTALNIEYAQLDFAYC